MGDAEAWRRWNAWRYVLHALEEIAPEALKDLARLVPVYREAAPHMDRIYDWESLEEALKFLMLVSGSEESLAKLKDFSPALGPFREPIDRLINRLKGFPPHATVGGSIVSWSWWAA
jgi:hypothetical protein